MGGTSALNKTAVSHNTEKVEKMKKVEGREITVRFMADTGATMKWDFRPQQNEVKVWQAE